MQKLPGQVRVLGSASLLNEMASGMVTPLLPLFLTSGLGAGPAALGLIEGVAEAGSSLLKLAAGSWSDRLRRQRPFVLCGYALSNFLRPLLFLATTWPGVLGLRAADRMGKGIRAAPRDAMIAGSTEPSERGRAFGFQRAMDHAGAVIGPLLAFILLQDGLSIRSVFLWSAIPGLILLGVVGFGLARDGRPSSHGYAAGGRVSRSALRLVIPASGLAFAAVPEAFVILWAHEAGVSVVWMPLLWAAAHAVRVPVVQIAGVVSDRLGRKVIVGAGWVFRIGIFVAMALAGASIAVAWMIFLGYAASTAMTEGAERAWIADLSDHSARGGTYGAYHMATGLMALPGGIVFGVLWEYFGSPEAFLVAAGLTALSVALLFMLNRTHEEIRHA
jgi:MFS family permease